MKAFIDREIESESTATLTKLPETFKSTNLEIYCQFVAQRCDRIRLLILKFENRSLLSNEIYDIINDLYLYLKSGLEQCKNDVSCEGLIGRELFGVAENKLRKYLFDGAQPAMELFRFARVLSPLVLKYSDKSLDAYNPPHFLKSSMLKEWDIYVSLASQIVVSENAEFDCRDWWITNKDRLPELYDIVKWILVVPGTSCDAERALSKYKGLCLNLYNYSFSLGSLIFIF